MSSEHPINGRLRLAWEEAITTVDSTLAVLNELRDRGVSGGPTVRQHELLCLANQAEQDAGRAYLGALRQIDPACSVCGCTQLDGCLPRCHWISVDPWICSTHHDGGGDAD